MPDSKRSILVVDDDPLMRDLLQRLLQGLGYLVRVAENGLDAKTIANLEDFDIIVSDITMPLLSGIELLKYVKANLKSKMILMTGFSEILEAQSAYLLGAEAFLAKPFKKEDLLAAVDLCLSGGRENQNAAEASADSTPQDSDFCQISLDEFTSGSQLKYEIYIRLSANKYVKIANEGAIVALDRIKVYKAKGLHYLHLKKEDFAKYVGFNIKLSKYIEKNQSVSHRTKLNQLKHTTEVLIQQVFVEGVDKQKFDMSADLIQTTVSLVAQDDDLGGILNMLNSHSDYLYSHSLGVSIYSCLIAKEMGWTSEGTLFKVSMAGLFHDIGKSEIPREILEKPRVKLTSDELKIIEGHTVRGREILSQVPRTPETVVQAAVQHHENLAGVGYPFRLKKDLINPISKLISLTNLFCGLVLDSPNSVKLSAADAVQSIYDNNRHEQDQSMLCALMKVINFPIPPGLEKFSVVLPP